MIVSIEWVYVCTEFSWAIALDDQEQNYLTILPSSVIEGWNGLIIGEIQTDPPLLTRPQSRVEQLDIFVCVGRNLVISAAKHTVEVYRVGAADRFTWSSIFNVEPLPATFIADSVVVST